ncbi:MAG TPA: hypothetical protein VD973_22110 [Symbiobacteriaceae bacterium]|jgi:hypothetical protein|nr:hypothetical protein [Symbiobacteriaceae bacterium]
MPNVYVFNTTASQMKLDLNGWDVMCGAGVQSGSSYAPTVVSVQYTPAQYPQGLFGSVNKFTTSFQGIQGAYQYTLNITNPTTDLQLYVFYDYILLAQVGNLTGSSGDVQNAPIQGTQVSGL